MRGHIPWATIDDRLRAARSIWLATTRPDGRPHAMPLWFWWDGRRPDRPRCYFQTARPTQKARNLAAEPSVVLHLGDGDDVVILLGAAVVVRRSSERARVDRAYRTKYVDPYTGASASIDENPVDDLYRVEVERVVAWSYGVVATWTEWSFSG